MRVLQVIDTLRPGGAENMAVNLANLLVGHVEGSYLCCTRESGILAERLRPEVQLFCLNKRSSLDFKALFRLVEFVKKNEIQIVHAHSTSYFITSLLKLLRPEIKLIWHDHYGNSESVSERKEPVLNFFSEWFDGVLVVNSILENWVKENLKIEKLKQLKNFVQIPAANEYNSCFKFSGKNKSFKIICVANLRPQKNHLVLIKAFEEIEESNFSLHLFGENPATLYSTKVLKRINKSPKSDKIFYYGPRKDIFDIIKKGDIGVLPSRSEGLPLALLEYALSGLPVICTKVGENKEVVGNYGKLIEPNSVEALKAALLEYYYNKERRDEDALKLKEKVANEYDITAVRHNLINFYNRILN